MMLKIVKLQHLNAASQRVRRALRRQSQHRQVSTVAVRSRVRHSFVDQTNMNASSSYRPHKYDHEELLVFFSLGLARSEVDFCWN